MRVFLKSISILLLMAVSLTTVRDLYFVVSNLTICMNGDVLSDIETGENGESQEQEKEIDDDEKFISFEKPKDTHLYISFDYILRHTAEIKSKSFKATLIHPPDIV